MSTGLVKYISQDELRASGALDGKGGVYCENVDVAAISRKDTSRMTINDLKDHTLRDRP